MSWRPVAIGLAALNVLFLAWSLWVAAPTDPAPASTRPAPTASTPPPPPAAPAPRCVSLGPFADAAVASTVLQRLAGGGLEARTRTERQQRRDGWWVWLGAPDAARQRQALAQIRRVGIQDAVALPDDAQFRISLGLYSDRSRAEQRATALKAFGFGPHVEEHFLERELQWLDVPAAGDRLSASRLEGFGITDSEVGAFDCP